MPRLAPRLGFEASAQVYEAFIGDLVAAMPLGDFAPQLYCSEEADSFRALYPGVELSVSSAPTAALLGRLRRRELDLALLTLPIVADDMQVTPVLKEELVVVTAPGHPLVRERPIQPKSLGRYPLILYESGSNTRRVPP